MLYATLALVGASPFISTRSSLPTQDGTDVEEEHRATTFACLISSTIYLLGGTALDRRDRCVFEASATPTAAEARE